LTPAVRREVHRQLAGLVPFRRCLLPSSSGIAQQTHCVDVASAAQQLAASAAAVVQRGAAAMHVTW
jgi:hypothetical protein